MHKCINIGESYRNFISLLYFCVIPILIVAINVLLIIVRWSSFPELLPAHFDLQGNAGGVMSRNILLLYPVISAAICLGAYLIAWKMRKLPVFMLAEPVILLATVVAFVVCVAKSR